jgi:hypothetical protein
LYAPSGLQPVLDRRGGRIVNLTGDGALIALVSAVEALSATIEFQQAMETESQRPEAKRLVFRVGLGLHLVNIRQDTPPARLLRPNINRCWTRLCDLPNSLVGNRGKRIWRASTTR